MSPDGAGRSDRWSALATPEAVAEAAERLRQIGQAPAEIEARRRCLDLLAPRPGERALDVGAGVGHVSLDVARCVTPGGQVDALDPSLELLEIARREAAGAGLDRVVRTQVGDGRAMPYADSSFDLALCHWVLLHVESPLDVVREMMRVIRPGGRMMCVEVDWETMIVHPGEPAVTRRIVEANLHRQIDARMGRKLVSLFRSAGLMQVRAEPIVDMDTDGDTHGWLAVVESRVPIAVAAGAISPAEGEAWWSELRQAVRRGHYFFSVTQFAVLGMRP